MRMVLVLVLVLLLSLAFLLYFAWQADAGNARGV